MNADNFTAGLFQAHNPASFAGGATSFLDCLMARLLEGGGGPVETIFRVNPFAGSRPRQLRMRCFLYEPCREGPDAWWTRRDIGPQRPTMRREDAAKMAPLCRAAAAYRALALRSRNAEAELPVPAWVCAVTEKLSHSTVPWAGKGERRTAFYKFVPYVRRPYLRPLPAVLCR